MEIQEFTKNAIKTESLIDSVEFNPKILEAAITGFMVSSWILDMIKKNVFYGKPIQPEAMVDAVIELGYVAKDLRTNVLDTHENIWETDAKTYDIDPRLFHAIIGICTESGELAELLGGVMFDRKEFDTVNFGEELGDIDWYKAIGADAANLDQANIMETVIKKLQKRYPDKFTSDAAINRDVGSERELLERNLE